MIVGIRQNLQSKSNHLRYVLILFYGVCEEPVIREFRENKVIRA
jgi:hypothetical protein